LFWSRGLAYKLTPIFNGETAETIRYEIDRVEVEDPGLGHTKGSVSYEELTEREPYLAGSFTGWRYKKMIPLQDFSRGHDKDYKEPFEHCQDTGKIRRRVETFDQCNDGEKIVVASKTFE